MHLVIAQEPGWPDVIQAIVSVINLAVIGYIFTHERREERVRQKQADDRELVSFRVRNLVLDRYMSLIHEYFDLCDKIMRDLRDMDRSKFDDAKLTLFKHGQIKNYKIQHSNINNRVVQTLLLISHEFRPLSELLTENEDKITGLLDSVQLDVANNLQSFDSGKVRRDFMNALLNAEFRALACRSRLTYPIV